MIYFKGKFIVFMINKTSRALFNFKRSFYKKDLYEVIIDL